MFNFLPATTGEVTWLLFINLDLSRLLSCSGIWDGVLEILDDGFRARLLGDSAISLPLEDTTGDGVTVCKGVVDFLPELPCVIFLDLFEGVLVWDGVKPLEPDFLDDTLLTLLAGDTEFDRFSLCDGVKTLLASTGLWVDVTLGEKLPEIFGILWLKGLSVNMKENHNQDNNSSKLLMF